MVAVLIIGARSAWLESLFSHWWPTLPRGGVQQHKGVLDHRAAVPSATGGRGSPPEPIQVRAAALLFQRNGKHPFSNTFYLAGDRPGYRPSEFCLLNAIYFLIYAAGMVAVCRRVLATPSSRSQGRGACSA